MTYQAPVDDIMQSLKTAAGLDELIGSGVLEGVDEDTIRAVIEEAGKFGAEVLDPLSMPGDRTGSKLVDGKVVTPDGWKDAYKQFADGGWGALAAPEEWGGQNLPQVVATAAGEIWNAANLAFGLCPLLTFGAIDAIEAQGSDELKKTYLPKMVTGEWTGTMNLTEPHAGSDLGALKTKAVKQADGTYRIFGTKIFITYGDHEMTDNIVHLVLARLPDAPPGTRGISLFVVPKYLVNKDGSLGARNDVVCAGVEHKLGIHASPTCVMKYGEKDGAIGYLVGEENRGLNVMFIMMNAARLAVGTQGVSVAERATQQAIAYAKDRRQGRTASSKGGEMGPIIEHADIRRTLMTMKALTQAARAICLVTARETDVAAPRQGPGAARGRCQPRGAADAHRQGVLHRHRLRGGLHGRAGARRHGLHRGDRRGADLSRCAHPADLRGHQRHPGHRPRRAQAAAGRRQGGRRLHRGAEQDRGGGARLQPSRVRPHGRAAGRGGGRAGRGLALDGRRACRRTRTRRWRARRRICGCSAWRRAASIWRAARWRRRATAARRSRSRSRASLPRTSPAPRRA